MPTVGSQHCRKAEAQPLPVVTVGVAGDSRLRVSLRVIEFVDKVNFRRFCVVFAVCLTFLVAPSTAAADAPWYWDAGHAWWGWNYVTPTVNTWVPGPTNYWDLLQVQLGSGGSVQFALFSYSTNDWCFRIRSVPATYHVAPGPYYGGNCGGYNRPYVGYNDGNNSYLRGDTFVVY